MAKVFLGVGHGGSDPGAVANGLKEAHLNLAIALACRDELERHGVTVKLSRTRDENDSLTEEIKECNAFNPDYALDIHNNAGGGDGAEVFHHHGGGRSKELAKNVLDAIVKHTGQNSRGLKTKVNNKGQDYFGFIRSTYAPAVIVECAFVDSKDVQIIDNTTEQNAMGKAIARGVLTTLGIKYKEPAKPSTAKPSTVKLDNTPDDYAVAAVNKAKKKGILKGDKTGNLMLHSAVTRQDFFTFLDRLGLLD